MSTDWAAHNMDGHYTGHPYAFGTRTTGIQSFDNVQLLNATRAGLGVRTGFALDAAKTTLTLAAALPRAVFPSFPSLSGGDVATGFDLSSTMSGHNKFFWENRDFACSSLTYDEGDESKLYILGWGRAWFA